MRGRDRFRKFKPLIDVLVKAAHLFPSRMRTKMFYRARYMKGNIGALVRYSWLKSIAAEVGDNVLIAEGVFLLNPQNLHIGNNVSVQPMSYLECLGGLHIGNDVSIAHGVTIMTTNHGYERTDIPIKDQEVILSEVRICDNVWIGAKATILSGNTIHEGAVVGGGGVVTKDVPQDTIVVGVPAKALKGR